MLMVIAIGLAVLIVIIVITIMAGAFDFQSFLAILLIAISYALGTSYIFYGRKKDDEENNKKKSLAYIWQKVNEEIMKMPNGKPLQWDKGQDRNGEVRTYYNGKEKTKFMSIYALDSRKLPVLIIYNLDEESIAKYKTNLSANEYADAWYNFKPFYSVGSNMIHDPLLGRSKRRKKAVTLSFDDDDELMPDDDTVQSTLNAINNGNQSI